MSEDESFSYAREENRTMSDKTCPECGVETDCETVHNGVALLHGPDFCTSCPWTEWSDAGKVIDGYLHDRAGGATPIGNAGMVEHIDADRWDW
jgi:hypothetical protein